MPGTDPKSVAAVVVTYNPDDRLAMLLAAVEPQVGALWLIDNGSRADTIAAFETGVPRFGDRAHVIRNPENRGLAAAQNQGIAAAVEAGYDWILLLDHDGVPHADMVREMLAAASVYEPSERIGFLAPRQENDDGARVAPVYSFARGPWFRRSRLAIGQVDDGLGFAMASGCLVPAARFREIGMMAEDYWIDYIDYEFAFRVRRAGYRIIGVGSARLRHRLGERTTDRIAGRKVSYATHAAFRRYTIYRNRIRAMRAHGGRFLGFVAFEILSITKDLVKLLFLESDKRAKARAIALGVLDGLAGRGGFREI